MIDYIKTEKAICRASERQNENTLSETSQSSLNFHSEQSEGSPLLKR